jgi:hypothetical protein
MAAIAILENVLLLQIMTDVVITINVLLIDVLLLVVLTVLLFVMMEMLALMTNVTQELDNVFTLLVLARTQTCALLQLVIKLKELFSLQRIVMMVLLVLLILAIQVVDVSIP